jgi:hypothetical protein
MSIRRDLLMRTALLRLPDLAALRAVAMAAPATVIAAAGQVRPKPRRRTRRKVAAATA